MICIPFPCSLDFTRAIQSQDGFSGFLNLKYISFEHDKALLCIFWPQDFWSGACTAVL
jgi:hypothetical protein